MAPQNTCKSYEDLKMKTNKSNGSLRSQGITPANWLYCTIAKLNLLNLSTSLRILLLPSEKMHLDCNRTALVSNLAGRRVCGSRENKDAILSFQLNGLADNFLAFRDVMHVFLTGSCTKWHDGSVKNITSRNIFRSSPWKL